MKLHKRRRCGRGFDPFCYAVKVTVICALLSLAANQLAGSSSVGYGSSLGSEFVPCTQISVQKRWTRSLARMNSESPLRAADLNGDGVQDVIFGYGVDDNIHYEGIPLPRCKSSQGEDEVPCEGGYTIDNLRVLRKQFLKQCLNERLVDSEPALPKYESQLIVTRIGITCTCRSLQPGEVCSELDPMDAQRWTEFMGNHGHGYYANR
ncbi:GL11954 [Drosophila persimilis]|uniref:GL11954 n=1 Tax=Drosophila persimilis TaxID=7234 RepID=B4GLX8_DROPE|nr:GL11954 [Drosophila persimilis]